MESGEYDRLYEGLNISFDSAQPKTAISGALTWSTPLEGLDIGASFLKGENGFRGEATVAPGVTFPMKMDVSGFLACVGSARYTRGPITLSAEYFNVDMTVSTEVGAFPRDERKTNIRGYYLMADWRATERCSLATGYSYGETDAFSNPTSQDDYFVSLRFDFTEHFSLKAEQHFSRGNLWVFEHENPDGIDDVWSMTLFKAIYTF